MAIYYVDTNAEAGGDGTTSATSGANCAWDTIADVNAASFSAGDSILFNRGCTWREQLTAPSSGSAGLPITFGAYGSGAKPRIYGSNQISTWEEEAAAASISKVQNAVEMYAGGNSVAADFSSTPTEGNLMVAMGRGTNAATNGSITGWTLASSTQATSTDWIGIWYKVAGAAESKTVTLGWAGSTGTVIIIEEWTGLTATPLDQIADTDTTGGAVATRSSGTTPETTVADELCIAIFGLGSTIASNSFSNSFVKEYGVNNVDNCFMASLVATATGAKETTLSLGTNRLAGGAIATFKGATGSANMWYATLATDPVAVWLIGNDGVIHWGKKETLKTSVNAEYDWWWDDPNNRLYVYAASDPDTRYASIEAGARSTCITDNAKDYITIRGLDLSFAQTVGVRIYVQTGWTVDSNTIRYIGWKNATLGEGVISRGASNIIQNNLIHDCGNHGINLSADAGQTVGSNIIQNNTIYDSYHSDIDLQCNGGTFTGPAIIRYNYLYNSAAYDYTYDAGGIYILGEFGQDVDGVQVYYNVIYQKAGTGIVIRDQVIDATVYNNTISGALSGSGITAKGIDIFSLGTYFPSGTIVKNNICVDTRDTCFEVADTDYVSAVDNNLWYRSAGGAAIYTKVGATSYHYNDQAAYKSDTGFDTNGKWQDPLFTSSSDFHLLPTSPAINAGVSVGLTSDYEGMPVPQGSAPDIGAYEYSSTTGDASSSSGSGVTTTNLLSALLSNEPGASQQKNDDGLRFNAMIKFKLKKKRR